LFEIQYTGDSVYYGSIYDLSAYSHVDDIRRNSGFMLYPSGKVIFGTWQYNTLKQQTYGRTVKLDDAMLAYYKGRSYSAFNKFADALTHFNNAIQLSVKEDSAYLFRGAAYSRLSKQDSALADIDVLLKKQAKNKDGLTWKAYILTVKKDTTAAIAVYDNLTKAFPKDSTPYWSRGWLYYSKKDFAKALTDFTKYLEITTGKNENVFYYRGLSYESLGKREEACKDYSTAKERGNKNAEQKVKSFCAQVTAGTQ
jgi:tetratricopeptide (TPR) repeat protein